MNEELKLTSQEEEIAIMLGDVWNKFLALPDEGYQSDATEFMQTIHSAQSQILMRVGRRQMHDRARKKHD